MPNPAIAIPLASTAVSGGVSMFNAKKQTDAAEEAQQVQTQAAQFSSEGLVDAARRSSEVQNYYNRRAMKGQNEQERRGMQTQNKYERLAGNAQRYAYNDALQEQQDQLNQFGRYLNPYMQSGRMGLEGQQALMGQGGPGAEQAAIDRIRAGGQFQEQQRMGIEDLLSTASSTGGLRGGNAQAALGQFSGKILNNLVRQQYDRLTGQVGVGQNASNQLGQAGMRSGEVMAGLFGQQGAAQARSYRNMGGNIADYNTGVGKNSFGYNTSVGANKSTMYIQQAKARAGMYNTQANAQTSGIRGVADAQTQGLSGLGSAFGQGLRAYSAYNNNDPYASSQVTTPTLRPV